MYTRILRVCTSSTTLPGAAGDSLEKSCIESLRKAFNKKAFCSVHGIVSLWTTWRAHSPAMSTVLVHGCQRGNEPLRVTFDDLATATVGQLKDKLAQLNCRMIAEDVELFFAGERLRDTTQTGKVAVLADYHLVSGSRVMAVQKS